MSLKDGLLNVIRPIAASYSTPRGTLAGIASLMGSPALGAAIRYGPELGKMLGALSSQSGTQQEFGGMSGMMPVGLAKAGRGAGGGSDIELSNLAQYLQRQRGMEGVPQMNQGGLVQQVIADRQRVLDSFTPNPYDQYQYLMENPATRQAPADDEVITGELLPATPTDPNEGRLSFDDFPSQDPNPPAMSPLEARIAELMENRGMTQEEAAANQAFASQQGADLNNDGAVTNAEYALFMRSQEPTVSTMPVGPMVPLMPNQIGGGFLSGLNTDAIQQAIEKYKASMGDRSGGVDAPAVTPTIPDNLQDRIAALTGGAGTFGGMIPNIDVARLRELMAELYGGQTPPVRGPEFRPPPPRRIMVDPRMSEGMR